MNKKIILGLIIIILLVATTAGCFENKAPKKKGASYDEVDGEYPTESGWLDSDMADSQQQVQATLPLEINASARITEINIKIKFDDYDSEHTESDDGSDPDEVTIKLTNGQMESDAVSGTTPCNLEVSMTPNETAEEETMTGTWEISVHALCGAGKPYTIIPRPGTISFLQYKDQGIAYELDVTYVHLVEK